MTACICAVSAPTFAVVEASSASSALFFAAAAAAAAASSSPASFDRLIDCFLAFFAAKSDACIDALSASNTAILAFAASNCAAMLEHLVLTASKSLSNVLTLDADEPTGYVSVLTSPPLLFPNRWYKLMASG